ncbi:hypothetical protein [Eggerthella timonensis]|uniref:hypothetical protein n=1 Tax=Eggerthella timonensis TaxID=1871008 RepID=UPI0015E073EA|nr:hypothetical protein [Eggerthella timonensis]
MSVLYAGWDVESLVRRLKERMDGIRALCATVLERDDAGEDARELAEGVLYELEGGDAE